VNQADLIPLMILAVHGLALGVGFAILAWMLAIQRRERSMQNFSHAESGSPASHRHQHLRPESWIAIRTASPEAVRMALGLNRAEPCSWEDGLTGGHEFFISPRVHGWVIVTGLGLPDPGEDVDATFLFLTALSRQLGHVQFFHASRLTHHHGWARLDDGCVTRAYAWTGETLWNQGVETLPEIEIGLKTFAYGEGTAAIFDAETNFEKVPQLAARWSLDPAEVKWHAFRQATGIAGESALI
jgi:hypothetical protein